MNIKQIRIFLLLNILYFFFIMWSFNFLLYNPNTVYGTLLQYQKNKIANSSDIELAFLGDSSLGNAIDAKYFSTLSSLKSINLAMTGYYGITSDFNFLKALHRKNPSLKKVILIHTPDMLLREISYKGYVQTMHGLWDIFDLDLKGMAEVLKTIFSQLFSWDYVKIFLKYKYNGSYEKKIDINELYKVDYVPQKKKLVFTKENMYKHSQAWIRRNSYELESKAYKNHRKLYPLQLIKEYCEKFDIEFVYIHGPLYEGFYNVSQPWYRYSSELISNLGIKFVKGAPLIPAGKLGDSEDHVENLYKKEFTLKYHKLLDQKIGL